MAKSRCFKPHILVSVVLTLTAAALLVYHVFCDPTRKFDGWGVALLVIVFLPWLGSIFETIEFPGGGKVEWRRKVEAKQERQATEIEGLQFLLAGFLPDDEREILQKLADGEPLEMSKHDVAKLNEQLRSLRRLTLVTQKASFEKLRADLAKSGDSYPLDDLCEVYEVTDRGRKYLELSKDLPAAQ